MTPPAPAAFRLHPLEKLDDPLLLPFLDLYESAFPQSERQPVSEFLALLHARARGESPRKQLRAAVDAGDGSFVGLAVYDRRPDLAPPGVCFFQFFAVSAARRGGGVGAALFDLVCDEMAAGDGGASLVVFEVEDPDTLPPGSEARTLAARRLGFYRRLGAQILTSGPRYAITVPHWPDPTPLLLAFRPLGGAAWPSAPECLSVARRVFPADRFTETSEPPALT